MVTASMTKKSYGELGISELAKLEREQGFRFSFSENRITDIEPVEDYEEELGQEL